MAKSNNNTSSGIGFTGLLTIVFITLKLCGVIKWAWIWVLIPIWFGLVLFFIGLVFYILFKLIFDR